MSGNKETRMVHGINNLDTFLWLLDSIAIAVSGIAIVTILCLMCSFRRHYKNLFVTEMVIPIDQETYYEIRAPGNSDSEISMMEQLHPTYLPYQRRVKHEGCLQTQPSLGILLQTWFIPADGIERDTITSTINYYLGHHARVRPGTGTGDYEVST